MKSTTIKTQHQLMSRNVMLYRICNILNEPLFWGPILFKSMQELASIKLDEIYYLEAFVNGVMLLLNVPSGALADIIGRKQLICTGRIALTISYVLFAFMENPIDVWIANTFWAIGYALQSGADTSLLKRSLEIIGRESEFKKIVGQTLGIRLGVTALTTLSVGYMAEYSLRLPLALCLPFLMISLTCSFMYVNPQ